MRGPSRKAKIIALANQKSAFLIREADDGSRRAENLEHIAAICQAFVQRAPPIRPSAKAVSEEGKNKTSLFPAEQTIFNSYPEIIQIWRKAYADIMNIDAPEPIPLEALDEIDPSQFEPGSQAVMEALICQVREVTRRNNALKQLISESIPTPADSIPGDAAGTMKRLSGWLSRMLDSSFSLDDQGLKVTSRSRPGTIVMESELFNELRTLADDYEVTRRARVAGAAA